MKIVIALLLTTVTSNDDASWNYLEAEWVESRLKVSSYRTHELLKVYFGKFGLQSVKTAIGGFLVEVPSIKSIHKGGHELSLGCDKLAAYKLLGWRPKSKRKRGKIRLVYSNDNKISVKRGKWIALMKRGGCSFSQKIRLATRLGAVAVIIVDNQDTDEPLAMNTLGKYRNRCKILT